MAKPARERIEAAIDELMKPRNVPFFSLILDDWEIIEDETLPTAATDGPRFWYNPKFIDELDDDDLRTLIMHEAGHVFLAHHLRLMGLDESNKDNEHPEFTIGMNIAADLALNWYLRELFKDKGKLREIALFPGEKEYADYPTGMDAEYYYKKLPANLKQSMAQTLKDMLKEAQANGGRGMGKPMPGGIVRGGIGDVRPHPSSKGSKEDQAKAQQKWENQVIGGIMIADGQTPEGKDGKNGDSKRPGGLKPGNTPGFIKEIVEKLIPTESGIDWKHLLRRFHHKNTRVRFSYARPNRRSSYRTDMMLPSRFARESSEGVFLVDTSGSMSLEEMNKALRETEKVLVAFPNSKVTLRQADTMLQKTEQIFTRWDFPIRVPQTWSGRGGTELAGPIAEVARSGKFNWMVVVTDMEWGYNRTQDPGIPTIWLQTKGLREDVPFGIAVDMSK